MGAPKGNQFWKQRSTHGREKIFSTPDLLWQAACEYFQWCEDNPIKDPRSFGQRNIQRPYTLVGMCRFLGVNSVYFQQLEDQFKGKEDEQSKEFSNIIILIKETCYQQKFENAVIGVYKENIIARDLGLTDKKDITTDGNPLNEKRPIVTLADGTQIEI
jgi:hypothetical protein